jgi:hypothetical protein
VLQEKREASFFLNQHLKDLLTQKNPDNHQGQDQREQLDVGMLVEHFVYKINAGKYSTALIIRRSPAHRTLHTSSSNFYQMIWFPIPREIMARCTQPGWEQSGELHLDGFGDQSIPIFSVILEDGR